MTHEEQVAFVVEHGYVEIVPNGKNKIHFPDSPEFFSRMEDVSDEALREGLRKIHERDVRIQ